MNSFVFAGAASGLKRGLEDQEARERERRQDGREDAADKRDMERDERDKVTSGQTVRLNNVKLTEAEAKASHDEFLRKYDEGMGRFIASDGEDTQSLESLYNDHYPDGENVKIARDPASKKFMLDFGNGRVAKDLEFEDVVGIGAGMKNPDSYMEHLAKSREREQKQQDELEKEGRDEKRDIAKSERDHKYRLTEKNTPGPVDSKIISDDEGNAYIAGPDGMRPLSVRGPAAGLSPAQQAAPARGPIDGLNGPAATTSPTTTPKSPTFKNLAKGSGKGSASQQKYEEMLELGVPDDVARATAYGTFKQVRDAETGATALIDVGSGAVVGQLTQDPDDASKAMWVPNEQGGARPPPPAAVQPAAPVTRAPHPPPSPALSSLKEGIHSRFKNGQVWTKVNGQPVQVQ